MTLIPVVMLVKGITFNPIWRIGDDQIHRIILKMASGSGNTGFVVKCAVCHIDM